MENNNAILVDAKNAYTNQLISLLTPRIYEGIQNIYENSKENLRGKNVRESFQLELADVQLWNQIIIDKETERIQEVTQCNYLDKLVTVIFINSTKILATAHTGNRNSANTLEISVPKFSHFIHRVYIETAREFYKNAYLMDENISSREKQDNLRGSIQAIKTGIEQAILRLLPIGDILMRDLSTNVPQIEDGEHVDTPTYPGTPEESSDEVEDEDDEVLEVRPEEELEEPEDDDNDLILESVSEAPVVSNEGAPIVSNEGAPMVSNEGAPIVSNEGAPIVSNEGAPIVSNEGAPMVSNEGAPMVSNEGAPMVSNEGAHVGEAFVVDNEEPLVGGVDAATETPTEVSVNNEVTDNPTEMSVSTSEAPNEVRETPTVSVSEEVTEAPTDVSEAPTEKKVEMEKDGDFVMVGRESPKITEEMVDQMNEANKEFIENNKDDSDLVDSLVEDLKSISLTEKDQKSLEKYSPTDENLMVSKLAESAGDLIDDPDYNPYSSSPEEVADARPEVADARPEPTIVQAEVPVVRPQVTEVRPDVAEAQSEVAKEVSAPQHVDDSPVVLEGTTTVAEARPEVTSIRPEVTSIRPEVTNVQPEVTNVRPEVTNVQPEVTNVRPKELRNKASNMLTTLRSDMSGATKFVNPYRMRRKINEKKLERLRNAKIKKNYLVNY